MTAMTSGPNSPINRLEPVDLLVFGPHPDDIEIGMAGTIARHVALGHRVGLCDLSAGEMGSNGTVEERRAEGDAAATLLGVGWRVNLGLPDRALEPSADHIMRVASLVRAARPRTVALPYWSDRHPDHVAASRLTKEAVFSAGLRRFSAEGEAWKPELTCFYFINDHSPPSFVVDVSDHYEIKRRALACHVSQFAPRAADATQTRLTSVRFQQLIESRDAHFGAQVGVAFAEGFVVTDVLTRPHLLPEAATR
jgi:bacillithiol biosynthesis deacetylase BshB1